MSLALFGRAGFGIAGYSGRNDKMAPPVAAPLAAGFGAPEEIGDARMYGDANIAIDSVTGNVVAIEAGGHSCWTSVRRAA